MNHFDSIGGWLPHLRYPNTANCGICKEGAHDDPLIQFTLRQALGFFSPPSRPELSTSAEVLISQEKAAEMVGRENREPGEGGDAGVTTNIPAGILVSATPSIVRAADFQLRA